MDYLIHKFENFSLWRVSLGSLFDLAKFVVVTNYKRHNVSYPINIDDEIEEVYRREKMQFQNSIFYAIKNNEGDILGTIRALRWNGIEVLPIQSVFNVNVDNIIEKESKENVWHIGCFAIDMGSLIRSSVIALKVLLTQAIYHVCSMSSSVMFAECDRKLYEKLKLLEICSCEAGESQYYIGSETVPVYNTSNKLKRFLWKQKDHLYINGIESIFPIMNRKKLKTTEFFLEEPAWAV